MKKPERKGLEPIFLNLESNVLPIKLPFHAFLIIKNTKRVTGLEPVLLDWKSRYLPINVYPQKYYLTMFPVITVSIA